MKSCKSLSAQARVIALHELKKRRSARAHLIDFTVYTKQDYFTGLHHRLLCEKLEAVEQGRIKRLMVFMPPRHGKSELTSKRFPAWFLGRNPTKQLIVASYSAKLSDSFGKDVRNIVGSRLFKNIFPAVSLSSDSKAKDLWETNQGGVFLSSGVGGSITGYGGDLAIIDDPVKDRQDAESLNIRDNIWDWYKSVLRTRIMPGGAIILALTRWHVDDLAGRLMNEMENGTGEVWDILHLPARAMEDDPLNRPLNAPLWADVFGEQELLQIEKAVGERDWLSLYQGIPTLVTGSFFKTLKVPVIDALPKSVQTVRRWDFAASQASRGYDPDWTVGVKMQRNEDGGYTILDVVRFRGCPDEVSQTVMSVASQDGIDVRIILPQDPGQAGVAQVQYYTKLLAGYKIQSVRETGDKATRADPFAAQVNMGNVALVRAPWNRSFLEELGTFPKGAHDDQVDAAAGAFSFIAIKKNLPKMPSFAKLLAIKKQQS
ncbi:phage terminase large subunit [Commensalibacter papalotli (ex Botero et al. 2024)]|uniref:Phage terminase large subunit n=1 Tax=Commensalibacter papalotli (ex Botero et al. 2024) TaxID=2972766 RepID=A0ABM9HKW1_9PROT|nr:phage terminase large subunit [Commensalibacter papalotli (ex Botero et al. 2024)]CAI3932254.1 Phage terminase large subunit [Commensalibacter papalotli (ex Botero et al. 2024)]CAI3946427.1 Phage terminase large subunit [Commensalibacter papalotli (ex Botero et al. 2024)]